MPSSDLPCPRYAARSLGMLAVLVAALAAALCVLGPSARADGPSLHADPAHPTNREPVTITGRFAGTDRGEHVLLQRENRTFTGNGWLPVTSTTTSKGAAFEFHLARIEGNETFRAVLSTGHGHQKVSKEFKLGIAYESVDRRWVRGDAAANRTTFFACFDSEGDQCASDDDANTSPTWLVLLLGIAVVIGYPVLMAGLMRADVMPPGRLGRAALFAVVLAVLAGWGALYDHAPAIAAGPFAVKTHWLNDAVHTWSLQWPVSVLWTVLEFFATPTGLLAFGALAAVSVPLPAPEGRRPGASALTLAHGAAANASAFIVGSAALAVISIIGFAVLVLAAVALMAYVMFSILVAFTTAAMLAYLLKR